MSPDCSLYSTPNMVWAKTPPPIITGVPSVLKWCRRIRPVPANSLPLVQWWIRELIYLNITKTTDSIKYSLQVNDWEHY